MTQLPRRAPFVASGFVAVAAAAAAVDLLTLAKRVDVGQLGVASQLRNLAVCVCVCVVWQTSNSTAMVTPQTMKRRDFCVCP